MERHLPRSLPSCGSGRAPGCWGEDREGSTSCHWPCMAGRVAGAAAVNYCRELTFNVASVTQQPPVRPNLGHQNSFPGFFCCCCFLLHKRVGAK